MTDISAKHFYRPDELAREIGVSTETVYRWMRKDLIHHVRLAKGRRIPREEFFRILAHGVSSRSLSIVTQA